MKTCNRCGEAKELSLFYKKGKVCKACVSEKARLYRETNKEAVAERKRAYYAANKEALNSTSRRYREANKAALAEYGRVYREANKAALTEYGRVYRRDNKAARAERNREYREAQKAEIAEKDRTRSAKGRYGVTHDDFPNTRCPIIRHLPADAIDHCGGRRRNLFTRGKVSGAANSLMGHFGDDPKLIRQAIEYIQGEVRVSGHVQDMSWPSKNTIKYLSSKFGITPERQKQMLDSQGWGCAICQCRLARTTKSAKELGGKLLATDHCHSTGRVRGILCKCCNSALGFAESKVNYGLSDTLWILERAAQYLEAYALAPKEPYKSAYFHEDPFWRCVLM